MRSVRVRGAITGTRCDGAKQALPCAYALPFSGVKLRADSSHLTVVSLSLPITFFSLRFNYMNVELFCFLTCVFVLCL